MQLRNVFMTKDLAFRVFGIFPLSIFHNLGREKLLKIAFWQIGINEEGGVVPHITMSRNHS